MASARAVRLDRCERFATAGARVVAVRAREVFDHADGVLDLDQPERVHDMRVATRRLRAVLEIFSACFAKSELRPVLKDVKRLADALGERRDPDVQVSRLEAFMAQAPANDRRAVALLIASLEGERERANQRLAGALEEATAKHLLARLERLSRSVR